MAVANRIESASVTVAAGTPQSGPATTDVSFPDGTLQRLEIVVPDGHAGFTGIQVLASNAQMVPYTAGAFLVANGETLAFDLVGQIDTGFFQVRAYNTDIYAHTFHLRFFVLDFAQQAPTVEPVAPTVTPTLA